MGNKHYSENFTTNYIKGNVYIITGAGSGFGRETALEIVKMGGKVVLMSKTAKTLDETVQQIEALGYKDSVAAMAGNVSNYEDNVKLVQLAVEKFGKVDAFFANAGTMPSAAFEDHDIALGPWEKCIDSNFKGVVYAICAVYDQFKAQGYGHMLATSSILGNFPSAGAGVYGATKIAVRYLLDALRAEEAGMIKTTYICPPGVNTNLASTIVKSSAKTGGIWGYNKPKLGQYAQEMASGEHPEYFDNNDIRYFQVSPEELVWSIMYALNQPRGIDISAITVHSSNDPAML